MLRTISKQVNGKRLTDLNEALKAKGIAPIAPAPAKVVSSPNQPAVSARWPASRSSDPDGAVTSLRFCRLFCRSRLTKLSVDAAVRTRQASKAFEILDAVVPVLNITTLVRRQRPLPSLRQASTLNKAGPAPSGATKSSFGCTQLGRGTESPAIGDRDRAAARISKGSFKMMGNHRSAFGNA